MYTNYLHVEQITNNYIEMRATYGLGAALCSSQPVESVSCLLAGQEGNYTSKKVACIHLEKQYWQNNLVSHVKPALTRNQCHREVHAVQTAAVPAAK